MQRLTDRLNRSRRLGRLLAFVSGYLANYRGMPLLLGIVFVLVSLVLQVLGLVTDLRSAAIIGTISLHLGLIMALVGILLAEPLGKG